MDGVAMAAVRGRVPRWGSVALAVVGQALVAGGWVIPGAFLDTLAVVAAAWSAGGTEGSLRFPEWFTRTAERRLVGIAFGAGLALRLWDLTGSPPGIWLDEGRSGWWATRFLAGESWWGMPEGPEPLAVYLLGFAFKWFGPHLWVARAAMALVGALTIPVAWWALRPACGPTLAVLTAVALAFTRWHLLVSRLATNYGLLPVCVLLVVGFYVRAVRRGGTGRWALVGAAAGFSLYSYTPARAIPVALAGAVGWELWRGGTRRIAPRELGAALGALAAVSAPLAVHALAEPALFWARLGFLSSPFRHHPFAAGASNLVGTLLLPFLRGEGTVMVSFPRDVNAPVLGAVASALAIAGLPAAMSSLGAAAGFVAWWAMANAAASILTGLSPMRLVGLFPVLCLAVAAGLTLLRPRPGTRPWLATVFLAALVCEEGAGFLSPRLWRADPSRVRWEFRVADQVLAQRIVAAAGGRAVYLSPATARPSLAGECFTASTVFSLTPALRSYIPPDTAWLARHRGVAVSIFVTREMRGLYRELEPGGRFITGVDAAGDAGAAAWLIDGSTAGKVALREVPLLTDTLETVHDLLGEGRPADAIALLTGAVRRWPRVGTLWSARAAIEIKLDDTAAAERDALAAVRESGDQDVRACSILGFINAQRRHYREAALRWERAVALDPAQPDVWSNLLAVYSATGNRAATRDALRRSRLAPGRPTP